MVGVVWNFGCLCLELEWVIGKKTNMNEGKTNQTWMNERTSNKHELIKSIKHEWNRKQQNKTKWNKREFIKHE